ncbi:MAG: hypothetical protein D6744_13340 [Planctomycetota bacterium]|nr:MAG: hypothetical protein D6744_13340 [Planctomycetota bacterium]
MVTVGAFARIDAAHRAELTQSLARLEGVETFDLGDEGKLGLLIESNSLDAAHELLATRIEPRNGVLCVWPVFVHAGEPHGFAPGPATCEGSSQHGIHTA